MNTVNFETNLQNESLKQSNIFNFDNLWIAEKSLNFFYFITRYQNIDNFKNASTSPKTENFLLNSNWSFLKKGHIKPISITANIEKTCFFNFQIKHYYYKSGRFDRFLINLLQTNKPSIHLKRVGFHSSANQRVKTRGQAFTPLVSQEIKIDTCPEILSAAPPMRPIYVASWGGAYSQKVSEPASSRRQFSIRKNRLRFFRRVLQYAPSHKATTPFLEESEIPQKGLMGLMRGAGYELENAFAGSYRKIKTAPETKSTILFPERF